MGSRAFPMTKRAGFSPRGGRGGKSVALFRKPNVDDLDLLRHPLGDLLATFSKSDLESATASLSSSPAIQKCQCVGSYNWVDAKSPTITVPGKPPAWTPPNEARRLQEDSGQYYRDPNAARFPEYPTEPAVHAIFQTNPDFTTSDVDIFGCGSTMGNLMRFVSSVDIPFRFSVEVIGNTVFFIRKQNDPRETIQGIRGFGHTFPEAYTTWGEDLKGSESHQRLIQYEFDGLKCVVRFECDGYIMDQEQTFKENTSSKMKQEPDVNSLLESFDNTTVGMHNPSSNEPIAIRNGGAVVSQDAIFDLKTRSGRFRREVDLQDIYPVLWLKQVPNFIIAYHDGAGLFEDIRVQDHREGIRCWENEHKSQIRCFAAILKKIIAVAQQSDNKLLEVYSPRVNHLEVREQHGEGSHALPDALMAKWGIVEDEVDSVEDPNESWDYYDNDDLGYGSDNFHDSDQEFPDFTACSADDCGYCGKCTY
ncbi:hypothetical protein P280DRAFT_472091 [Massarina eburnea CBS 473.64]|uniref:Geranylgeranyl pyrophosphate synthetase n=1 Tax=Massarina eburnea CBS 473.64 TaxID=1395130 RepID=A0A6A6RPT7_9PLEO|nr:hypothetical protein P280DRAFT_472091 [Massarina eburnea CBS 473.64]